MKLTLRIRMYNSGNPNYKDIQFDAPDGNAELDLHVERDGMPHVLGRFRIERGGDVMRLMVDDAEVWSS